MGYRMKGAGKYYRTIEDQAGNVHAVLLRMSNWNWRLYTPDERPYPKASEAGFPEAVQAVHEFRKLAAERCE